MPILDRIAGEVSAVRTFEVRIEALYKERTCSNVLRWSEQELA